MTITVTETKEGLQYNPTLCNRCGICVEVCPFNVWEMPEEGPAIPARLEDCTNCTACAKNCLGGALSVTNMGCGCIWNQGAQLQGKCSDSVVGSAEADSDCSTDNTSCCG
ncbi:MAG: 4Fe-4S dicluster domain-containing protein [Candidatus Thorarchaeota archaeon]